MQALTNKINKLTREAEELVNRRAKLEQEQHQVEVRLTQIVGALQELQLLEQEIKAEDAGEDQDKNDN